MITELLLNISHEPHHLVRQSHYPERHTAVYPSLGVAHYFLLVPVLSWSFISDVCCSCNRHPSSHYDLCLCMDGTAELWTWSERPEYVDVDLFDSLEPDPCSPVARKQAAGAKHSAYPSLSVRPNRMSID